jgi:putative protease
MPYELLVDGEQKPLADARYLLSPGDLSALRHLPQIIATGVRCLKIEGRYKGADYVALTTRAYRQAVDDAWAGRASSITPRQELELEQVYSRSRAAFHLRRKPSESCERMQPAASRCAYRHGHRRS